MTVQILPFVEQHFQSELDEILKLTGVPAGFDALVLGDIARLKSRRDQDVPVSLLHIARDEQRLSAFARTMRFFAPDIEIIEFPAWDCLPYDRVGPNAMVESRRLRAMVDLVALAQAPRSAAHPRIVVTTSTAVLQRITSRELICTRNWQAKAGNTVDVRALTQFLESNSYHQAGTVVEPGEYALRGGIVDVFPSGATAPVRLDFFGKTLESIRSFDPETQRTTYQQREVSFFPVSEVVLDEESISRFRQGYVAEFGPVKDEDPLYESISAGRRYRGFEHWLPLFYERLETVFDYVPGAYISMDELSTQAVNERLVQIADHYDNRVNSLAGGAFGAPAYKPLKPQALYLTSGEWEVLCSAPHISVSSFSPAGVDGKVGQSIIVDLGVRAGRDFSFERHDQSQSVFDVVTAHVHKLTETSRKVLIMAASDGARDRLLTLLTDHGLPTATVVDTYPDLDSKPVKSVTFGTLDLDRGFETDELAVLSEQDILGTRLVRTSTAKRARDFLTEVMSLSISDLVVHVDHGIGRFAGLITVEAAGAPHDCLEVHYHGGDKLYVPVENIEILSRYGHEDVDVMLDRLGGVGWQTRKANAHKRIHEIADQLIKVAAARASQPGLQIVADDGMFAEFCSRFAYEETEDQQNSIDQVLKDLASGNPMDRLVCGDVGFGKTEVALRSAFATAITGYQCAVVVPTTLLARQHLNTFQERFRGFPIQIAGASRLVGAKQLAETKKGITDGTIDIVIGTHALLAKDVSFQRLGLLIIDEEQHFGVTHKERLKDMRHMVHVLTLTATPIPRTLQLALSGARDLSLIASPPVDRLAVRTFITPFDPVSIREALLRELYRGGQSFFVCPRIADLSGIADFLTEYVPEVKFVQAHGRMPAVDLDRIMNAFYEGEFDVLLSTTIIESGLDVPSANTLIVFRSDKFGLSQLYQLRGRVGRSKTRAYALFTVPAEHSLTEGAEKRLKVLQSLDSLGAGFNLASHDLDIRGAGNLLGDEQSGHIREVGFELYQSMLEDAVASLRAGDNEIVDEQRWSPLISVGAAVLISEDYVPDLQLRLGLYRRLSTLRDTYSLDEFAAELVDRFGSLPNEVKHLLRVVAIKIECRSASISRFDAGPKGALISFRNNIFARPAALISWIESMGIFARIRPDQNVVITRNWEEIDERLLGAEKIVREIAEIANGK